ncbi:MAG: hypothetical protein FWH20_01025 [Oscillospiraceae bacterium]|nr:hypothetical protein [Oscillospiraceae bacterium]
METAPVPAFREFTAANAGVPAPPRPVLRAGARSAPNPQSQSPDTQAEPPEQPLTPQEQLILREEIVREYEALRVQYIAEGEKSRLDAREWAQRLIETTENDIRKLYAKNEQECTDLREKASTDGHKEGYDRGYSEGNQKGYSEGYEKGLNESKETLRELMANLEYVDKERERFFKEHETQVYDAIYTIANKITVKSLGQKDKAVITRMLKEAAKGFRNSEFVKVTLSKLDVEQLGTAGVDTLKEVFRENQFIEFEVVKDAPPGTLILDNGSEITDAGVATQLMMIEKLGKGKFREKSDTAD